jgi:hypothetical protein
LWFFVVVATNPTDASDVRETQKNIASTSGKKYLILCECQFVADSGLFI